MSSEATNGSASKDDNGQQKHGSAAGIAEELKEFYKQHGLDLTVLLNSSKDASPFPYRFVRLNPRFARDESLQLLEKEFQSKPLLVKWVGEEWDFYALPPNSALSSSECFQSGRVYGMDVSSGAGIAALFSDHKKDAADLPQRPDNNVRVLDLCCCPGLKLCAMADYWMGKAATVVGVDISKHRMALCKNIMQKYQVDKETSGPNQPSTRCNIQLYCQDGTTFGLDESDNNLVFDSRAALEEAQTRGKRKRMNKSARARERKRLRHLAAADWSRKDTHNEDDEKEKGDPSSRLNIIPFDYVLVDAECSTDGSLKHMKERLKADPAGQESNAMLTDKHQLADLVDLQKRLLASGFRLLRVGGILVYSTCSLSHAQNEGVVEWLLAEHTNAYVIKVEFAEASASKLVINGSVEGTLRFYPNLIGQEDSLGLYGDGFFVAKIGKR